MVVLRDGVPMTVGETSSDGLGMVTAGGVIYGISRNDPKGLIGDGEPTEFMLWRSEEGAEWSTVDLPAPARGELGWAYLTAGHDRLMLTVGVPEESGFIQVVLTSTDGETWEEVELPMPFTEPAVPQATDFGWMIQNLGGPEPGAFQTDRVTLLLSSNGTDWVTESSWGGRGNVVAFAPSPVVYEAGLFARNPYSVGQSFKTYVWQITDE
jgi:hypothetical protein